MSFPDRCPDVGSRRRAEPRLVLFHQIGQHGKSINSDFISSNDPPHDLSVVIANEVAVYL